MGLLAQAFNPRPRANWAATDERWYVRDISGYVMEAAAAASGVALSADTILRCGTVLAAVRFRGDSWAMCPPATFRKVGPDRVEVPDHYSQRVLRNPNGWQTGNRWRHLMGVWMATWGNAYSEMIAGPKSFAEELRPLHPSVTRVIDQRANGSLIYEHTPAGLPRRVLGQERILHFRDLSTDGVSGIEMYRLIRNTVGIALLAEQHASTFLRKGARVSGLLVPSAPLEKTARDDLRESVNQDFGGGQNTGTIGILPHGVELKELSFSNRDAQFLELSDQVVGMILRFLGVPGVVVGWADKTATYASAEAFFEKGGIKHCVLPILCNVEAEEEKALLLPDGGLQIKHNLDVLLRANWTDRIAGLVKAAGGPIWSVNEARAIEDFDRLPEPEYDRPYVPSNMMGGEQAKEGREETEAPPRRPQPPRREPEDEEMGRPEPAPLARSRDQLLAELYARDNAERVIRMEMRAIAQKAPKLARNADAWRTFVLEFFGKHAGHVCEVMRISETEARAYCDRQASALLAGGAAAAEKWEDEVVPRLVALALRREEDAAA